MTATLGAGEPLFGSFRHEQSCRPNRFDVQRGAIVREGGVEP